MSPSSSAALPPAVIHGFSRELAQTASTARRTGPEHAGDLGRGPVHLRHEHQPEAAEDGVDGSVGEREVGRVLLGEADAAEPELGRAAAGDLDHLGGDVRREELAARLQQRQRPEARLARACGELEQQLPRPGVEQLDHPLREERGRAREQAAPPLPAGGDAAPRLDLLRRELVYVVTPLNCGRMCSP